MNYKMFSPAALQHFAKFAEATRRNSVSIAPSAHEGAFDVASPGTRRRMARDNEEAQRARYGSQNNRGNSTKNRIADDDEQESSYGYRGGKEPKGSRADTRTNRVTSIATDDSPDPDSVNAVLKALRETLGDDAAGAVMKALHQNWPGCAGKQADDVEAEQEAFGIDPGDNNEEAMDEEEEDTSYGKEDDDDPDVEQGWGKDNPPPFKGMPKTGGKMVGASDSAYFKRFPMCARIGINRYGDPANKYGDGRPAPKRSAKKLAMDSKRAARNAADYAKRWPNAAKIGLA